MTVDYQKGKIYTIRCRTDDTMIYIGSTTQSLAKRWGGHKTNMNTLIYRTINNDWDNWYIELYELYPCSCKIELERKEGEIIRLIGTLNYNIAGRTKSEYNNENIDKVRERKKIYYIENIDKLREINKKYRDENPDKEKERQELYRAENRDILNDKKKEKITCECGCLTSKNNLYRHLKTKKHIDLINKNIR